MKSLKRYDNAWIVTSLFFVDIIELQITYKKEIDDTTIMDD